MSPVEEKIMEELLTEEFIMNITGYSKASLDTYRYTKSPRVPPSKKIGTKFFYPKREFMRWLERQPMLKGHG